VIGREPEAVHHARTETLDDDIGGGDQIPRHEQVLSLVEVKNRRTLVALQHGVDGMVPAWAARRIHANDICAVFSQQ
jgi:uncharacterized membrane protein YgcG